MPMKHCPCAYCGTLEFEREKGHVVPRCVYPPSFDSKVRRITVPECSRCKTIWQDAETQFRNMLAIAGEPNAHVRELWEGPIARSFDKPSGQRWRSDLIEQLVAVETEEGPRYKVYPDRDQRVMLVVRKIIRGLCHNEGLATAVDERRVWAGIMAYNLPEEYRRDMTWKNLGNEFFSYGFADLNDSQHDIHSAWLLTFFDRRQFIGLVSFSEAAWAST